MMMQDLHPIQQAPLKQYPEAVPNVSGNRPFNIKSTIVDVCDLLKQPHRASRPDHIVVILRGLPGFFSFLNSNLVFSYIRTLSC